MKKNITIAALSVNLCLALTAVCLVSNSDNIPAMLGTVVWLSFAAWLCRKHSHLIPDDRD